MKAMTRKIAKRMIYSYLCLVFIAVGPQFANAADVKVVDTKAADAKKQTVTPASASPNKPTSPVAIPAFYQIPLKTLTGKDFDLANYRNHVFLIVNTASKCGYTKQFDGLEGLYKKYRDQGFVVLGIPSNDFKQEDLEGEDIEKFCRLNYGVSFPMMAKTHVNGDQRHALYKYLLQDAKAPNQDIGWNFEKILVDRNGKVVARYPSATTPEDKELLKALDSALSEKGSYKPE
jgi:glutathione peroxidase